MIELWWDMLSHYTRYSEGQGLLTVTLLVGLIVAAIAATLAFLSGSLANNGYAYKASAQAGAAATSGAEDALLQINRNATFGSAGYSFAVGSSTATVTATRNSPSNGLTTILSTATVSGYTKTVQVVVSVNATTSAVSVISWQNT